MPESFKDNEGRQWDIRMDYGAAKRVKALVGINLLAPLEEVEPDGQPLLTRLARDDMMVIDVIFAIIKPQADERGMKDEEWAGAMGGDAMLEAHDGFYREYVNFFRSRGRAETMMALQKQKAALDAAIREAEARIRKLDPDLIVEEAFSGLDTNSPGSAE